MPIFATILSVIAPMAIRIMTYMGFKEEQIKKFLEWVDLQQRDRKDSTLPSEEAELAKAKLKAKIDGEKNGS